MLNTVHTKIATLLATLEGTGKPLGIVYDDLLDKDEEVTSFPAVIIGLSRFSNEYLTNEENIFGSTFTLYLVQETEIAGMSKANRILRQTTDTIIDTFATNWDQGATSEGHRIWWKINLGNSFYDSDEKQLYYELQLTTNLVFNN